ncbi:MAG: hypothetical protein IKQ48_00410 [Paludibacteraceae bacterium]|nr:hypothetical protein [Paludibacteraceae bacterium]MBR4263026.1 hypothetical protein [Paludibacteraceae bacterium]
MDSIEEVNASFARTRFTIPANCPLVSENILPLSGLMENAAQTCATRAGNTIGYIGAVKQMEVSRFPHVGETLTTEAVVVQEVMNISLMECTTRIGDELIATTTLKIATIE